MFFFIAKECVLGATQLWIWILCGYWYLKCWLKSLILRLAYQHKSLSENVNTISSFIKSTMFCFLCIVYSFISDICTRPCSFSSKSLVDVLNQFWKWLGPGLCPDMFHVSSGTLYFQSCIRILQIQRINIMRSKGFQHVY